MRRIRAIITLIGVCLLLLPAKMTAAEDGEGATPDTVRNNIGGKYYFIPDSLSGDVEQLLKGHSRVVDDPMNLDLEERVIFRGDTLPQVLKDPNLGRFDRGLSRILFIPKGVWSFGLTASYGNFSTDNLEIFSLLSDIDVKARAFTIKPYLQYFIRNNMAIGLRFGYYNARGDISSFKVDISDDMNFSLHDVVYKAESYTAGLTFSQYVGLTRLGRFGLYNEIELAFSSGSSDFRRPYAGVVKDTHTTWMEAQLNFSPGVEVFIMKNVSFHVSFGVFGFDLRSENQTEDGEKLGNRFTSGANFRFNIFNINFGIGVSI